MKRSPKLHIFPAKEQLAHQLAVEFSQLVARLSNEQQQVNIALSGGSTPNLFFRAMAELHAKPDWNRVRFFWVDERCVPPEHPESNFGVAQTNFLVPLGIPRENYFRIRGEDNPEEEARRYAQLVRSKVTPEKTLPVFDLVFLGMGGDGHTASIFPNQSVLWNEPQLCTVGTHPDSGQKRVSFTGRLINAAARVVFLVTGEEKAPLVKKVVTKTGNYSDYPASLVDPYHGELEWYLDEAAAQALN